MHAYHLNIQNVTQVLSAYHASSPEEYLDPYPGDYGTIDCYYYCHHNPVNKKG